MTTSSTIEGVWAWEALDSRGNPTVACELRLAGGATGTAMAPSGASTGHHEAIELRDGGERFGGRGVRQAVASVGELLGPAVIGVDAADQAGVDARLAATDPSTVFATAGANAVVAVSVAALRAAAAAAGLPLYRWLLGDEPPLLPMPMVNVLSGGAHAGGSIDVQDFLVVPVGAASFAEAIEWAWRVRNAAAALAAADGHPSTLVADEGGLGLTLESNRAALDLLVTAIEVAGLVPGHDAAIAIDVAATQLANGSGTYVLTTEQRTLTAGEMVAELSTWLDRYPIVSLEDPLGDDDWQGWADAGAALCPRVQVLGDDLFVTDTARVEQGITAGVANAVLVKPNQVGHVTGAHRVVQRARAAGWATVLSARSGETEEDWLADLAAGWRTGQIKVGSVMRSERTAKWNRLLRIEAEAADATFAGAAPLVPRMR